jgi:hypothetical protein
MSSSGRVLCARQPPSRVLAHATDRCYLALEDGNSTEELPVDDDDSDARF